MSPEQRKFMMSISGSMASRPGSGGSVIVMPDGSMQPSESFFQRFGGGGASFTGAMNTRDRGYIIFPELDTRKELTSFSRTELMRKARWFFNNDPRAKRLGRAIPRMVGALMPMPRSNDRDWVLESISRFRRHAMSPRLFDRAGKFNWVTYQRFITRRWMTDGELLSNFSRGKTGSTQVSAFEANRIGSGSDVPIHMQDRLFDGVTVDRGGAHLKYRIPDPDDPKKFTDLPASSSILSTAWERYGQHRGVTPFHPVITRMHDMREVTSDFMKQIKATSLFGFYLANSEKDVSPPGNRGIGAGVRSQYLDAQGAEVSDKTDAKRVVTYEEAMASGAMPDYSGGWEPKILESANPTGNQMDLLKWFSREVAYTFDFPPELVFEIMSLNGNTQRYLKEDVQEVLEDLRGELLVPFCQAYWYMWMGNEIHNNGFREPEDGIWYLVDWAHPRKKSIDRGAEGRLNLEEMRTPGVRTLERHFGELQEDWRDNVDQWMDETDYMIESAHERDWSPAMIDRLKQSRVSAPAGVGGTAGPAGADSEAPDSKSEKEEVDDDEEDDQ
ncbi:MAG: phage portal protein [Verrucomicrobiota bacterium]